MCDEGPEVEIMQDLDSKERDTATPRIPLVEVGSGKGCEE